jgi:hypothetical protein
MEGFEGMPKLNGKIDEGKETPVSPGISRAPMSLTGKNANLQTLRTFQSDLADTIKSGEGSMIKIAMAENARNEREQENIDPESSKNRVYIFGGIMLVLVAFGILGFTLYRSVPKTIPVTQNPAGTASIIKIDSVLGLNITGLTRDNIRDQIGKQYEGATLTINTIARILPFTQDTGSDTQRVLTTQEFFSSIESVAPSGMLRSLNPTFTIGVHAFNGNGLFFAFKTDSYTTALAGMLEWEQSLFDELYNAFAIDTTGDNSGLFAAQFKDRTIKNQDTRALMNSKGEVVLFYTFIGEDKSTLIITNNSNTLEEILNRLTANTLRR